MLPTKEQAERMNHYRAFVSPATATAFANDIVIGNVGSSTDVLDRFGTMNRAQRRAYRSEMRKQGATQAKGIAAARKHGWRE